MRDEGNSFGETGETKEAGELPTEKNRESGKTEETG